VASGKNAQNVTNLGDLFMLTYAGFRRFHGTVEREHFASNANIHGS